MVVCAQFNSRFNSLLHHQQNRELHTCRRQNLLHSTFQAIIHGKRWSSLSYLNERTHAMLTWAQSSITSNHVSHHSFLACNCGRWKITTTALIFRKLRRRFRPRAAQGEVELASVVAQPNARRPGRGADFRGDAGHRSDRKCLIAVHDELCSINYTTTTIE